MFIAGVVTLVYVKHDDGKDATGCILKGDVESNEWSMAGEMAKRGADDDFGKNAFFFHGNLNTSQGRSWYIDTPIAPAPVPARFFQMHVQIMGESNNIINGPEAYYGWAYNATPKEGGYAFNWKVWPNNIGADQVDPKEKLESGAVMRGLGR